MKKAEKYVYYDDDNARCVFEFHRGMAFIHLEIRRWNTDVLLGLRYRWPAVMEMISNLGYKKLYAYTSRGTPQRWLDFAGRFGFKEFKRTKNFVVMEV